MPDAAPRAEVGGTRRLQLLHRGLRLRGEAGPNLACEYQDKRRQGGHANPFHHRSLLTLFVRATSDRPQAYHHNTLAATILKTGVDYRRIFCSWPKQEIVMASSRSRQRATALACTASSATGFLWAGAALASQGPGAGPGTASGFTQLTMAILVYGVSALVVGAGLIGAVRRH
jgi:hypothetical protein